VKLCGPLDIKIPEVPDIKLKITILKAPAQHSGENSEYEQGLNKNCKF
jgi:hypothetical protein